MANTQSAKKQIRASQKKRKHNLYWKKRIKEAAKDLKKAFLSKEKDTGILNTKLKALQKSLDKASKEKVIHKNKANRIKSKYAKKITAQGQKPKTAGTKPAKSAESK